MSRLEPTPDSQVGRFCSVLRELVHAQQVHERALVGRHGVSASQRHLLDTLEVSGSNSIGKLASKLSLDISTMTRLVDGLELKGLVTRQTDPRDRRRVRVRLTTPGRARLERTRIDLAAAYERTLESLPVSDVDDLTAKLAQVLALVTGTTRDAEGENR